MRLNWIDDLDVESCVHFESLQHILREQGINFEINLRFVEGSTTITVRYLNGYR